MSEGSWGRDVWMSDDQKLRAERRTVRRLRKELKEIRASRKPVEKSRLAVAVINGLNDYHWDQSQCSGACKNHWLKGLFDYLSRQGVSLK